MSQAVDDSSTQRDASLVWQQLSERIDAFVEAWQQPDAEPAIANFLPEAAGALRRLTLAEAIKVDLEQRWQRAGGGKLVEEYAREFPELAVDGEIACDIIYEEYHVRKQRGEQIAAEQYFERFPARAEELKRMFRLENPAHSTSIARTQRVPTFEAGQKIDDFDLLKPLGKGAFASVFLARQCSMQRLVALKISLDRGFEPQTLAQMEHPHIVRVFDQRQSSEHKLRLLYMQYVPGGTLLDVVDHARGVPAHLRRGATLIEAVDRALVRNGEQPPGDSLTRYRLQGLSWPEAVCWLGARLAAGLAFAHERGILHRDVKPANVLVAADGHPKLADFNISFSKIDGATPAAYFGGSLAYMSPEQLEAFDPSHARQPDELDERSDVYALGVVLWELLTLRRPFSDGGLGDALDEMTNRRHKGVSLETRVQAERECPQAVVRTLLKCLEPDPARRHATAAELARELELCLQPRAYALLRGQIGGSWFRKHPVRSTICLGLLPNLVMTGLVIAYNHKTMEALSFDAQNLFKNFQIIAVNAAAYSIGLGYIAATRGKLFVALARLAGGKPAEPNPDFGRRCLTLGFATALVAAVLWSLSGLVFPLWLRFGTDVASGLQPKLFGEFVASNILGGLIAATQTYYVATFFSVRYCYPWLFTNPGLGAGDANDLADVARRGRIFLGLSVLAPFLAIPALVVLRFEPSAVLALGGVGLVGCGLAYLLDLVIRGDVAALATATQAGGDTMIGTDSVESHLAGSRRR